jgi:hypothetical protein
MLDLTNSLYQTLSENPFNQRNWCPQHLGKS